MWDKRIVEKIDVFVGEYVLACSFRSVEEDFFLGLLLGFMVLILMLSEVLFGMSWLASFLGG